MVSYLEKLPCLRAMTGSALQNACRVIGRLARKPNKGSSKHFNGHHNAEIRHLRNDWLSYRNQLGSEW